MSRLKRTASAVGVGALAIGLFSGCGADYTEAEKEPAVVEETSTLSPEDNLYLMALGTSGNPELVNEDDALLIEVGNSVCESLRAGDPIELLIYSLATDPEVTISDETIGEIFGAAIPSYCPEQMSQLTQFVETYRTDQIAA